MCRYAFHNYKRKWACFECRKSFKRASPYEKWVVGMEAFPVVCPQCQGKMHNMGLDFKAPRQSDKEQWKKVELLLANGYNFSSCGCNGPGPRPARLKEVSAFVEENKKQALEMERWTKIAARAKLLKSSRKKKMKRNEDKRHDRLQASMNG